MFIEVIPAKAVVRQAHPPESRLGGIEGESSELNASWMPVEDPVSCGDHVRHDKSR